MNALANGDQRFLALTSSRAPRDVIEPLGNFSPVRGSSGGSTSTSLHTSSNISAMRSLRELCPLIFGTNGGMGAECSMFVKDVVVKLKTLFT